MQMVCTGPDFLKKSSENHIGQICLGNCKKVWWRDGARNF